MKRLLLITAILLALHSLASATERGDSVRIVSLLQEGQKQPKEARFMYYAHALCGTPYVGHTLERRIIEEGEHLEVNMSEMDCTTYIENVLALTLATEQATYAAFRSQLQRVRYRDGILDGYASRNHYFAQWVESGERQGILQAVKEGDATQHLRLDYMTTHRNLYPGIRTNTAEYKRIRQYEQESTGAEIKYFSREALRKSDEGTDSGHLKSVVKTGDILGIVTKKQGLDTTHLGIAVWQDGQLHLLNASRLRGRVVVEPRTLYQYMLTQPSQLGIRVVRVK